MVKLILDCLGGDHSPNAHVKGAVDALQQFNDLSIVLTGDESVISKELSKFTFEKSRIEVVHAPDVITGDDKPTDAIRMKKDSSMMKAVSLLHDSQEIDGLVSTGATGALVAAATLRIGRLEGVQRPAFCPVLPTMNGGIVGICDSGANVDCTPERLVQFAIMGERYMSLVYGIECPRVALLNVGTEAAKGDELRKQTYPLLEKCGFNFVGNMESRDLLSGKYDLIVCDGFSGNVLIKSTEGACLEMLKKLKKDIYAKKINQFGAFFMRKMFQEEKAFMNYQNYGGSVLLGIRKVIIKGHGSSNDTAVTSCIKQAYLMIASGLQKEIENGIKMNSED